MKRWISLFCLLIIGLSITFALDRYYRQSEYTRSARMLKVSTERFQRIISHSLTDLTATGDLKAFLISRGSLPSQDEFTHYAAESKKYYPTVSLLQYRDPYGKVVYSYRTSDHTADIDFLQETGFIQTMEKAKREKKMALTSPIQTAPGHLSIIALDPLYIDNTLVGFAENFFDIEVLLEDAYANINGLEGHMYVRLSDDEGTVFWQKGTDTSAAGALVQTEHIAVGENFWLATIVWQYPQQSASYILRLLWGCGFLITFLIAILINGVWLRQQWLAKEVSAKTVELIAKNETLLQARQAQAQAAKLSTLGAMTAGISHEINQPLNSIKILSSGIIYAYNNGQQYEAEEILEMIQEISHQVDRINEIITHMKSLIRKDYSQTVYCSLNYAIQQSLHMTEKQIISHGINLILNLREDLPPVKASPTALEEVVANILINAIQALDEITGEKTIIVRTYFSDAIYLEISDNGPGIKDEVKAKIFEPFISTRSEGENLGLGLFIVHSIVTSYGGIIQLNSSAAGTTCMIKFPLPQKKEVERDEDTGC